MGSVGAFNFASRTQTSGVALDAGRAEWRGASDDRVRLKLALRDKLSEVSAIAKVLESGALPDG